MSDEVWGHLDGQWTVPGLHRYVRARADEPVETIDAVVRAGAHLLPSGDNLAGKVAQIGRAVELRDSSGEAGGTGGRADMHSHIARCASVPALQKSMSSVPGFGCSAAGWRAGNRRPWLGSGLLAHPPSRGLLCQAPPLARARS